MVLTSDEDLQEDIDNAVFPGVVSNHHLHAVAGLAIFLAEILEFGEEYANQVVDNARALADALNEGEIDVVGSEKGYTDFHLILADITDSGLGADLRGDWRRRI